MTQAWQGKSKGTPLGYRIFVAVLRRFGVRPAYFLLWFVSFYYFLFSRESNRAILDLYRNHLGIETGKARRMLWQNYRWLGHTIIDKIVLMSGLPNKFTFDFDGEEHLHTMAANGKGGMLIGAHLGNWEIAGFLLKRIDVPINVVLYDAEHQQIKNYLEGVTGKRNMNVIVIRDDFSHIFEISAALNRNEFVCIHGDRFIKGHRTLSHFFIDGEALFPQGPFQLASRIDVPVTFVYAVKESAMHYHFSSTPPVTYFRQDRDAGMRTALAEYVKELEIKLRTYPEQWFNYYSFWHN